MKSRRLRSLTIDTIMGNLHFILHLQAILQLVSGIFVLLLGILSLGRLLLRKSTEIYGIVITERFFEEDRVFFNSTFGIIVGIIGICFIGNLFLRIFNLNELKKFQTEPKSDTIQKIYTFYLLGVLSDFVLLFFGSYIFCLLTVLELENVIEKVDQVTDSHPMIQLKKKFDRIKLGAFLKCIPGIGHVIFGVGLMNISELILVELKKSQFEWFGGIVGLPRSSRIYPPGNSFQTQYAKGSTREMQLNIMETSDQKRTEDGNMFLIEARQAVTKQTVTGQLVAEQTVAEQTVAEQTVTQQVVSSEAMPELGMTTEQFSLELPMTLSQTTESPHSGTIQSAAMKSKSTNPETQTQSLRAEDMIRLPSQLMTRIAKNFKYRSILLSVLLFLAVALIIIVLIVSFTHPGFFLMLFELFLRVGYHSFRNIQLYLLGPMEDKWFFIPLLSIVGLLELSGIGMSILKVLLMINLKKMHSITQDKVLREYFWYNFGGFIFQFFHLYIISYPLRIIEFAILKNYIEKLIRGYPSSALFKAHEGAVVMRVG